MKNVLITGASGGIGRVLVNHFLSAGYFVIGVYHNQRMQKKAGVEYFSCDLTHEKEVENLVGEVIKKYHHIDCLVNCAGVSQFKQIQDVSEEDYDFILNSNLKSAVFVTKHVAKNMISAQTGKIINISSMWGNVGASVESIYSASKGAINSLTLSLAKELAPSGITVNAVCPGLIDTKMNSTLSKRAKQDLISSTPLGRIGTAEDVANAVDFLASEKADFITGQLLTVDGGLSL